MRGESIRREEEGRGRRIRREGEWSRGRRVERREG